MPPLSDISNAQQPSLDSVLCKKCKKRKHFEDFPVKTSGPGKGQERAATCSQCAERRAHKRAEKEKEIPLTPFESFFNVLGEYAAGSGRSGLEEGLEARIALPSDLQGGNGKEVAGLIVERLGTALGWRFMCVNAIRLPFVPAFAYMTLY